MIVACPDCDALQVAAADGRAVARGHRDDDRGDGAFCFRCGAVLVRRGGRGLRLPLAYAAAALPLLAAVHVFPAIRIDGPGAQVEATVLGAAMDLFVRRAPAIGALIFVTTVVLPALHLVGLSYLLLARAAARRRGWPAVGAVFRLVRAIRPWAALEILLLALLVTSAKLSQLVAVAPGAGLWCLMGFLVLERAASTSFDPRRFWQRIGSRA
jgi:paraquat-inducible protein A